MVKVCVVVVSGHAEKDVVERDRFWNDLGRIDHRVDNVYKLYMLRDLNGFG